MKNATALLGFAAITAAIGFKLSDDPVYTSALQAKNYNNLTELAEKEDSVKSIAKNTQSNAAEAKNKAVTGDSLIRFAHKFLGHKYVYGGNEPGGFDCSGFTNYVYKNFGYVVPHGSVNQASAGKQIPADEVKRGDLLIFTGTNLSIRKPGHAGIVISKKGEKPVRFIHASSVGGVKISEVEGTRYADRLLQVRRIL